LSEIHKFLFDGLPVRGVVVRLTDAWTEVLSRRAAHSTHGGFPEPLQNLLGEMTAAAVLMQSSIKFNGSLVLQVHGDGPVKLAVVEVQSNFGLRATATFDGDLATQTSLSQLVNLNNRGRCAITLDPKDRQPGQQPYQGVVPLFGDAGEKLEKFSDVLQHYMLQSEQLDTTLVLAADANVAAGLLIQRLPTEGQGNLGTSHDEDQIGLNEDYRRIALLASSLKREELLSLDVDTLLHRLFWDESVLRFDQKPGANAPHFECSCSQERVAKMLIGLGVEEANSIIEEFGEVEVSCDFCSAQYRFDKVDVAGLFQSGENQPPASPLVQ
jgi:molecular chaperone Hsp33